MTGRRKPPPTVSLWAAVDAGGLWALAEAGWASWPQLNADDQVVQGYLLREEAVSVVRDELARQQGEGSLVVFDVPADVTSWRDVRAVGDRLLIPKGRRLTKVIVGDISEEAQYQRGVEASELDAVQLAFGEPVPAAWRAMVTAPTWLRRGWMTTGAHVELHPPLDAVRITRDWWGELIFHPSALVIGRDGAGRTLAIDLRENDPPVLAFDALSTGWDDGVQQAISVADLAERLEVGDFGSTA